MHVARRDKQRRIAAKVLQGFVLIDNTMILSLFQVCLRRRFCVFGFYSVSDDLCEIDVMKKAPFYLVMKHSTVVEYLSSVE